MDLNCNKDADTVQVALRIRPLVESEISRGCIDCVEVFPELEQVQVRDLRFTYNHVFPAHVGQREFYEVSVKSLINKLFQGYNVTILAYGQTGSGKTYSMGTNYNYESSGSIQGIIPQAVGDIFDYVEAHEKEFIFKISVSFMELYQEQCYDLLAGRPRPQSVVEIREDHTGVILPGLTDIEVNTASETMMHLTKGSEGRAVGATAMNACSSRSHAVFTIYIYKESKQDKNNATTSKFHLVDLAGSERSKKTKATGDRLKEGIKINQGLLALGNVISALGDGTNRGFISYRDSKLTRLLQDSLGGNSVTLMIACISPADYNLEETVSTLRYADRARRIKNKPVVNQDAKAAEISRLNKLVNDLRLQLMGKIPLGDTEAFNQLQEKYDDLLRENQIIIDKHKKVTNVLTTLLQEHTNMCEKALLAEAAKEKMERKLLEITEKCNQTFNAINESNDERSDEGYKGSLIDCVRDMKSKLEELRTEQLTCDSEIIQHELRDTGNTIHNDGEEDEDNIYQQEAHAFETAKLNTELHALNQAMALKAELVRQITASTNELTVRGQNLRDDVGKVASLEKERDELMQQLRNAKNKNKDPVDENRRKRVAALEEEITSLKKKCQQQASIIKVKEQNEAKIRALTNEIHSMKSTKVQLIKRMRAESEQFRRWKQESERNMTRLKAEDSKRRFAMQRMEAMHLKQHNVLKRKMEQAVAVTKRLKEALDKQKAVQLKRSKSNNKAEAVVNWLDQELEMMISTVHAEKTLEDLMEDRSVLTEELERLRTEGKEENNARITQLQDDLSFRNAQISDIQQRILAADQENKARSRWDSVQSMQEAKSAMKHLFDNLVETKKEVQWQKWDKNDPIKQLQEELETVKKENDELRKKDAENKLEINLIEKNFEEKVSALLGVNGANGQAETQIALLRELQHKNELLMVELEELKQKHGEVRAKMPPPANQKPKQPKQRIVDYIELEDDDDESGDELDNDKDPEFRLTPMYKRKQQAKRASRLTMNFTLEPNRSKSNDDRTSIISNSSTSTAVKRASDGTSRCICRGSCSSKHCGCVKADSQCGGNCRCMVALCKNRTPPEDENKENLSVKTELEDSKTPERKEKFECLLGTSSVKKRKYFFFKNNDDGIQNVSDSHVIFDSE